MKINNREFVNFGNTLRSLITSGITTNSQRGFNDRIDLSMGGGYRKIFGESLLVGVNGFYDASRLGNRWYGSPGVGVEMAALGAGHDLIDLNFNYYGNLFQGRNSIINAFRNGPGNFDLEVGYSLELGAYGPDLRLKLTGYQFDVGSKVWGWNGGAEVTSRNGMFSVKAEAGRDKINGTYYTLGGYANVGLQLENLLKGESPFTAPEPIFRSPRNLRRVLTQKVRRNWHQPSTIVVGRSESNCGNTSRFIESLGTTSTTPFVFNTDIEPFVPVPYQCLRRGGRVSVTFTYNFGLLPTGSVAFSPLVADEAFFFGTLETELLSPPYSQTGTLTILFTTTPQSIFVDNGVNPGTFRLIAVAGPFSGQTLSISNILIQFNQ